MPITRLPKTAYKIIRLLSTHELLTQDEIVDYLNNEVNKKNVKYAIRRLSENNIIQNVPHLLDMRSTRYRLANPDEMDEVSDSLTDELYQKVKNAMQEQHITTTQSSAGVRT